MLVISYDYVACYLVFESEWLVCQGKGNMGNKNADGNRCGEFYGDVEWSA